MIVRLRAQYAELTRSGADLSSKYGARHPATGTVRAQLGILVVDEEVQRILQSRRHIYEVAAAREASLQKSLDELQGVSTNTGQAQIRLRELQREAEANRTLYKSFLARYKEANARESLEMPEARIVTKAEAPIRRSFPKISLLLGLALLLGPHLGCVLALASDYFDRRIKTLEQAAANLDLPGLAAIPLVASRELARLAKRGRAELDGSIPRTARLLPPALQPALMRYAIEEPSSMFAEAVRTIRLALQRASQSQDRTSRDGHICPGRRRQDHPEAGHLHVPGGSRTRRWPSWKYGYSSDLEMTRSLLAKAWSASVSARDVDEQRPYINDSH